MRSTAIDRRRFMVWAAACGGGLASARALGASGATAGDPGLSLYLAARKNAGRHEAALIDAQGRDQRVIPLPGRGHSFAIDAARGRVVAFGRQPGFFAVAFDTEGKRPPLTLDAAPGRHFFGHGVFSPDGRLMAATENDYEAGRGVLGLY